MNNSAMYFSDCVLVLKNFTSKIMNKVINNKSVLVPLRSKKRVLTPGDKIELSLIVTEGYTE